MKKVFVLLTLLAFIACVPVPAQTIKHDVKTEQIDTSKHTLVNDVATSLKDQATQDSIASIIKAEIDNLPESGSNWKVWLVFIIGLLVLIIGAIAANVPTKKNRWYLQIIQVILRFISKNILVPENKKTDGTNHSV